MMLPGAKRRRRTMSIIIIINRAMSIGPRWILPAWSKWRASVSRWEPKRHRSRKWPAGSPATNLNPRARKAKQGTELRQLPLRGEHWLTERNEGRRKVRYCDDIVRRQPKTRIRAAGGAGSAFGCKDLAPRDLSEAQEFGGGTLRLLHRRDGNRRDWFESAMRGSRKFAESILEVGNERPSRIPVLVFAFWRHASYSQYTGHCRSADGDRVATNNAFSGAKLSGDGLARESAWQSDAENFGAQGRPFRLCRGASRATGAGQRGEAKSMFVDLCVQPIGQSVAAYRRI